MNKKQLKLFIILFVLAFNILNLTNRVSFQPVKATYVEGPIVRDTIWTRVDSPLIVSNNVTVDPAVTLTIEPGVEVRFGENLSLIVNGRIVADGTEDKIIRFTSNNMTADNGDWGTILFNGIQPSSLTNCIIEYGTSGITLESGSLTLQSSFMKFNSENGITVNDGNLIVKNCEISNNTACGIYLAGGTQVTLQDNIISSNHDGMFLTGHLIGEINIEQNNVSHNEQSGIVLESDAYDNTDIVNNNVSMNTDGFTVLSNVSTYIAYNCISNNMIGINYVSGGDHRATWNHILNNTMGIYYQAGSNHGAHFNDICSANSDDFAMDAIPTASANATYNYWGDKTGPKHYSLNPYALGNRVGGNGVNLDFLFFLTASIDFNNTRPTAVLWTDKTLVAPNQTITLVGTDSYDDGRVNQYIFDFNDTSSVQTTLSLFEHNYSRIGTYSASLKVIDDFNVTSENVAMTTINVQNLTPLNVSITLSNETVAYGGQVQVEVYVSNQIGPVENANITLFSVKGGNFNIPSASTNSTGYFTATFTAPNVTDITDVRIIARANKTGYADGSEFEYLKVLPPLTVRVTAEEPVIKSEDSTTVTVDVALGVGRPIMGALLILSSDYGTILPAWGVTDLNGSAQFVFTAPQTLSQIGVTIGATAVKMEYTEGYGQATITVEPKVLIVDGTAKPPIVISGETSTITARVTSGGEPVSNATIDALSDIGEILPIASATDTNGVATFVFAAPQMAVRDGANATIGLTATKNGYVNGEKRMTITIMARILIVEVDTQSNVTVSEANVSITAHVAYAYDMSPVSGANVTIASNDGGTFSNTTGLTDSYGNATFVFAASPVNASIDVTISASASKAGYVDGNNQSIITVNPGVINIEVETASQAVPSGEAISIQVHVTTGTNQSLANASIAISSNYGSFSGITGLSDSSGLCTFVFNAPETSMQLPVVIGVNASKNGYVGAENQTSLAVTPKQASEGGGGLSLMTILLIVIPIVIAVIVVALVKLKVISVGFKEEE
jgi:parallel beta-helix repeat protein